MLFASLPPALHERQLRLFARYDPAVSASAFKRLLQVYVHPECGSR